MDKQNSAAAHSSNDKQTTQQTLTNSKDATQRRRGNIPMVRNVFLIWLDNKIDEGNDDCQNTLTQLRRIINAVEIFTSADECIDFLTDIDTVKIIMIISGELSQNVLPLIYNITQLDSVFIFCGNRKRHEQWAKEWPKIKGVFTEISPICKALKGTAQQCEHNAIGMTFMPTSSGATSAASDQLDCSFMYTQIMKEILLEIKFEEHHTRRNTSTTVGMHSPIMIKN